MQKRRYTLDEFEAYESSQDEDVKIRYKIRWHFSSYSA
jgi:hypothetical protein